MKLRFSMTGLAVIAIVAGACSSSATTAPSAAAGGGIALLLPSVDAARYEAADQPDFKAKVAELCPTVAYTYNNAAGSAATQQQQAEAAMTNGAKVLVLDAQDGGAAGTIVTEAQAKGVKVISYDRLITGAGSKPDYYISFDNEKVGELQGTALLAKLTADGKTMANVVWINGSPKDNNATLFKQGAHKILDGKVTIVKEDAMANWKPEEAQQIMEAAITSLGKTGFDAVYVANDGGAGGAFAAMKSNGVDPTTKPMTGQDAELAAIQRILLGQQYMTVYKAIKPEAEAAATLACALATGQTPAATTATVNNGTVDVPSILLVPIPVTADGSNGTQAVEATVVADAFYGATSAASICDAKVDAGLPAACTKYGVK